MKNPWKLRNTEYQPIGTCTGFPGDWGGILPQSQCVWGPRQEHFDFSRAPSHVDSNKWSVGARPCDSTCIICVYQQCVLIILLRNIEFRLCYCPTYSYKSTSCDLSQKPLQNTSHYTPTFDPDPPPPRINPVRKHKSLKINTAGATYFLARTLFLTIVDSNTGVFRTTRISIVIVTGGSSGRLQLKMEPNFELRNNLWLSYRRHVWKECRRPYGESTQRTRVDMKGQYIGYLGTGCVNSCWLSLLLHIWRVSRRTNWRSIQRPLWKRCRRPVGVRIETCGEGSGGPMTGRKRDMYAECLRGHLEGPQQWHVWRGPKSPFEGPEK
jgi:hypothetical protein